MPEKKNYTIFWERLANSGVIENCMAENPEEAVDTCGFSPEFVKHTVVDGKVVAVIGKIDGGKL